MRKANWGCGSIQADGWYNIDKQDFGQEYIGSTELFADNYFDIIVAHASLQINDIHSLPSILLELNRILKSGGMLRVSLPDIMLGFHAYERNDKNWFPNSEENIELRFSNWLTWYGTTKTLLTENAVRLILEQAGFITFQSEFKQTICEHKEIVELDTREGEFIFIDAMPQEK